MAADSEDGGIDEWVNGEVIAVEPTGKHEEAIAFLVSEFNFEIRRSGLPYVLPRTYTLKPAAPNTGYKPDVPC